jgi:hypothetical protein
MARIDLFQGTTTHQLTVGPQRPESDLRTEKTGRIKRMHALRRGGAAHVAQVLFQESKDLRAGQVIALDFHGNGRISW